MADENIRVIIRTGTSTRAPIIHPDDQIVSNDGINLRAIFEIILHGGNMEDSLTDFLHSTLNDGELERDPNVILDLDGPHHCKTTEVGIVCGICHNPTKLGDIVSSIEECKHIFHHSCIDEWGKYKQECPLCRKQIPILER